MIGSRRWASRVLQAGVVTAAVVGAAPAQAALNPVTTVSGVLDGLSGAAAPLLDAATPYAGVPGNMNTPDLDGDGRADLAVPDFGTDLLSVRINDGHGGFGPVTRYKVGVKPSFITRGDFDRDGHTDLAVSDAASAEVSVLLGNGDGTLRAARAYPLGTSDGSFSIEAADVTGDGLTDLVTSNSVTNDLSVLPGRGDGTFGAASAYPIAGPHSVGVIPFALSLGDFDGDGDIDAMTGGVASVTVMRNDGHGAFTATSSNLVGLDIACTKLGDLNEDGRPDAVATGTGTLDAQILLGRGDGSFTNGQTLFSLGIGPQCLSVADFDRDGHLDLAVVNSSSLALRGVVAILRGDGHGHFGGSIATTTYPVQYAPWATDTADFDGDGRVDLAVANSVPASVSILSGTGDGRFAPQVTYGM